MGRTLADIEEGAGIGVRADVLVAHEEVGAGGSASSGHLDGTGKADGLAIGESLLSWHALRRNVTLDRVRRELGLRGQRALASPAAVFVALFLLAVFVIVWLSTRLALAC